MVENAMRLEKMNFNKDGDRTRTKEEKMIMFAKNFEKNMRKRKD